jgi:hypothetical protein
LEPFVRTVLTYLLTSLYLATAGAVGLLIAVPLKWAGLLYEIGHAGVGLSLATAGIRYRVAGRENAKAMEVGGFVAVERENKDAAFQSIEQAAASIRSGNTFLIFPEGTRSRTEELLPFKKGGFLMAIRAQAPVVPVAVMGARDSMRKGSAIIRPAMVTVRIGEPVETAGLGPDDRDQLIQTVRARIEALLRLGPIT